MLRVFWWRGGPREGNFGDCLTPLLCESLTGRRVEYANIAEADLVAIGSLLEPFFFRQGSWDQYSRVVWGTGRMYGGRDKLQLTKAHVAALRGRLTLENVVMSGDRDVRLGDPVLLAARLARPLPKRYKLGLVPHHSEHAQPLIREIADRSPDITVIDICGGVQTVLDQFAQCEFILSSALHGLVAADALGIPNEWLWLDGSHHARAGKPPFKYRDYYSVFGLQDKQPIRLSPHNTLDDILARFGSYERPGLQQIQQRLLDGFPFYRSADVLPLPDPGAMDVRAGSPIQNVTGEKIPSIGLCMIVKNEAHVIQRCLDSVRPLITRWTIVDTGSTDGTQDIIRKSLADVPGELHEWPWVDFAHNRSEALALAAPHSEYLLVIDADDVFETAPNFSLPQLMHDAYSLTVVDQNVRYERIHLVRAACGWRYEGVLHEHITCDHQHTKTSLPGLTYRRLGGGARSRDPNKFLKDAAVLQKALEREPNNARYAFYLAQSWRDAGRFPDAVTAYRKRAEMGGWEEETWYSLYEVARLLEKTDASYDAVVAAYLRAYAFRPIRAESLTKLAGYLRQKKEWPTAFLFASTAVSTPRPADILFVDDAVYSWQALDEFAISAYWVGRYSASRDACQRLLSGGRLPDAEIPRVQRNLAFAEQRLSGR